MITMATGAYLGSKAEQDVHKAEIAEEARELDEHPGEELAELVALYQREGLSFTEAKGVAEHIAADKDLWLRTLVEKELGISPEITSNPLKDAFTMGTAFILAAMVPILPYFFDEGNIAITASVAATLVGLFALGVGKGRIVQRSPVLQGLEILVLGAAAAGLGFALGEFIPRLIT
jgi:VIT1/CCC1 family predicted Fe2+/Mn2+ transporter